MKILIDVAIEGTLMGKSIDIVKTLLEEIDSKNYHQFSERTTPKRSNGRYKVDVARVLASKVDTLAQRLDRVGISPTPGNSLGPIAVYVICEICGVQGHTFMECDDSPYFVELANALQSFNPPPWNISYPNAYNHG